MTSRTRLTANTCQKLNGVQTLFAGFPEKYLPTLKKAARLVYKNQNIKKGEVTFIMVSDVEIKKINTKYLKHRRITDIITFVISQELFIGDVYIASGQSQKQANFYGNSWEAELAYLTLHGALHLCGYTDYDNASKAKMFKLQDKLFKELKR
ncbi:MAG: rRNA maturation RNase YbeY [Elusimicrobia bacterium]|nr:rRNA maturation RNase YbeY [Elusimicrobiota bacterium]